MLYLMFLFSDHAACLLDLVNQVESSHGGRPSPASASRRRPDPAIMEDIEYLRPESIEVSEEAGEEEEEESRILEEVFFVRWYTKIIDFQNPD